MWKKAISVLLALACMAACFSGCSSSEETVPVQSVAEILGIGPLGMVDRYAGVIEAGESVSVDSDSTMEIKEIAVSEGDTVTKGQVLFSYETTVLSLDKERLELEVEQTNNTITTKKNQITALKKEQSAAASADKLQYTLQIQQLELDIKEAEYSVTSKKKEIERIKVRLADTNVLSPVDGRIKSVNAGGNSMDPMTGEPLPLITITQSGDFRVRGTVSEMTAQTFMEGTAVIIRSRVDEDVFWNGSVLSVDWENPVTNQNDYYYMPSDEMTISSKYPFYVELASSEGLMLGQHVYIEQDIGQGSGDENALYLPAYYLSELDEEPWVWVANGKDKLEKRTVVLGNYDIEMDTFEVLEGLSLEDYIAYPNEGYKAGSKVRYTDEEEILPEEDGAILDEEGAILDEEGVILDEEGVILDEEGAILDENGMIADEEILVGDEEGAVDEEGAADAPAEFTIDSAAGGAITDSGIRWGGTAAQPMVGNLTRTDPGVAAIPGTEAVG